MVPTISHPHIIPSVEDTYDAGVPVNDVLSHPPTVDADDQKHL